MTDDALSDRKKVLALLERGLGHVVARHDEIVKGWRARAGALRRLHSKVAAGADLDGLSDRDRELISNPLEGL